MEKELRDYFYNLYLERSMIPKEYIGLELTDEHKQLISDITKEFKPFEKNKIYLYSDSVGTGKTTIATWMLQKLLNMDKVLIKEWNTYKTHNSYGDTVYVSCPAYYVNMRTYLYMKKRSFNDKDLIPKVNIMEDCMLNSKFLIIDEFGSIGEMSDFDSSLIYVMLDERNNKDVTTIFTSNITPNQLLYSVNGSIARRVLQDAKSVEVK